MNHFRLISLSTTLVTSISGVCAADSVVDNLTVNAAAILKGAVSVTPVSGDAGINLNAGGAQLTLAQLAGNDAIIGTQTANGLQLRTGGQYRMFITASGNVGIGGIPAYTFDVFGQTRMQGNVIIGTDPVGPEILRVGGDVQTGSTLRVFGSSGSQQGLNIGVSNTRRFAWVRDTNDTLLLYSDNTSWGGGAGTLMYFRPQGEIGIGQTPVGGGARVQVGGPIQSSAVGNLATGLMAGMFGDGVKRVHIGYDSTYGYCISAVEAGISWRDLNINRLGGAVIVGADPVGSGILRVGGGANFSGNVGIGVANPTSKLAVAGTISASEVKVTANPADYVFADDYKLRPLSEVEMHVKADRHLPGVPSAQEQIQAGSVSLSEMQRLHLEKIEELTLYAIECDKKINNQQSAIEQLKGDNDALKLRLERIEALLRK